MPNEFEFDLDGFERGLEESLQRSHDAFMGRYANELNQLAGLSRSEIDAITPDTTDLMVYDALITVVKEASRSNASQAVLRDRIESLGDIAVSIASRIPALASLLR